MARKPLPLGTHGDIRLYGRLDGRWVPRSQIPKGTRLTQWRAIANYRSHDGETRPVERSGTSIGDATNRLREHFADRNATHATTAATGSATAGVASIDRYLRAIATQLAPGMPLTTNSRVIEAVPAYLARIREECTATTCDRYVSVLRTHVTPKLGRLLLTECSVPRLQEFEASLVSNRQIKNGSKVAPGKLSPKARKVVREVVRGVLQVAVEADLIKHNPVKSMRKIRGGPQNPAKAISAPDIPAFFAKIDADKRGVAIDLPTIIRTLFGLGCRIGEAMALCWQYVNLSEEPVTRTAFAGTPDETTRVIPPRHVWINATITEPEGGGTARTPVKSKRGDRVIAIPEVLYLLFSIRKTADIGDEEPVFLNPGPGIWRSPRRVGGSIRTLRQRIGVPEFKTHAGRKTAATVLYDAGYSGVADLIGHASDDFTRANYVTPGAANPESAAILDRVLSGKTE